EVTVAIEIGQRDAMMNAELAGTPVSGDFLKFKVAEIVEGDDGRVKMGINAAIEHFLLCEDFLALGQISHAGKVRLMLFDFVGGVDVLHVLGVAGGDEEVFVAVEVDVKKDR